ncbi:MAG TPA: exodeoxyribonuclease VII small subunit [Pseudothauera hydrothermalis]|jgi:exodeoxyribonuclease VII small subunit|nr:exodeoxyribonuclease VII small subunit [Rhodocyclaceae bacterium]HNQ75426.1 exodeoxyribonuclease VII small subunit [Pseudothauera hydrothermalis]
MARTASAPENFESAISELERIVREMESGELSLEHALERYQRGVGLLKFCQKTLSRAQERIRILEADTLQPLPSAGESSS